MRRIQVLLAFITVAFLVLSAGWAFAGDGKAQGQPFQTLQHQIDELKAQIMATQGAIKVSDDTGQFVGTLVERPGNIDEGCYAFIPDLRKFARLGSSGEIATGSLTYSSPNCAGEPLLGNINHHWLVAIFNGTAYSFYTGGMRLGAYYLQTPSYRRPDGSCFNGTGPTIDNWFEAVHLDASEIQFQLPFVTPYHYE